MSTGITQHRASDSPLSAIGFWGGMTVAFVLGWLAVNKAALHMTSRAARPTSEPELESKAAGNLPLESVAGPSPVSSIAAAESGDTDTAMSASPPSKKFEV